MTLFNQTGSSKSLPIQKLLEFQSEVLITGFLRLACHAGPGTQIKLICSRTPRWKGDRADFVNGKLYRPEDVYITTDGHNIYEPFWVRTFRFLRLKISYRNQPLTLHHFQIREAYYPLSICNQINDSHEMETMWRISLSTLQNCMHET
jgi:alpha-L-rhamnosidase